MTGQDLLMFLSSLPQSQLQSQVWIDTETASPHKLTEAVAIGVKGKTDNSSPKIVISYDW